MKFHNFFKRIISIRRFLVYEIESVTTPNILIDKLEIKPITLSNINIARQLRNENVVNAFKNFISDGEKGFYILREEKCLAHGWLIENKENASNIVYKYFKMPPKSGFIHYCYVDESQRGKGLYKFLLVHLRNYYFGQNTSDKKLLIDTGINNIPAQKAIKAVGGKYLHTLRIFRFLGKNVLIQRLK